MTDRRTFLAGATVLAGALGSGAAQTAAPAGNRPQWIWYPGQLAAYRLKRRVRLAVQRCVHVGYPANFRQSLSQMWFRRRGRTDRDVMLRWAAPVGRVRVTAGRRGADITDRQLLFRAGSADIVVQIDFADTMPCLFLSGEGFSSDVGWEASPDGLTWGPVETAGLFDATILPDAERETVVPLPVRTLVPAAPARPTYRLAAGEELIVDFHETELGALRYTAQGAGLLRVQVGETVSEVRDPDPKALEQFALPPLTLSDTPQPVALPERALRYARFTATGPVTLAAMRFDARLWPAQEQGHFTCSDPEINAIWTAAVATIRSNMHDFYLDGIRRDGLVWHDGPLALEAGERVFFDADIARQTLVAETLPERPGVRDIGIIDSQMYDIIGFDTEYRMRGDASFPHLFAGRIREILDFYISLQDGDGFVDARRIEPYGYFPDWAGVRALDPHGVPTYGQMLLSAALLAGSRLAGAWGDMDAQARYAGIAARLRATIRQRFLDPRTGLYANGIDRAGQPDPRLTSYAQAFAVAFDIAEPGERAPLFAFLNDETKRPARMSLSQVVELAAYAKAGRTRDGIARLKRAWLPILKAGHRRFFEDIDPTKNARAQLALYSRPYGNSLCHIWAGAAPVLLLSKGVLGIEPTAPGFRECDVRPVPGGIRSGRGSVPTPHGPIAVEWDGDRAHVEVPSGSRVRLPGGRIAEGGRRTAFRIDNLG